VQTLKERQAKIGVVDPAKPIFTTSQDGYVNASNLTNRYWVPLRKRAGYEWVTFHTFRKAVGTRLDEAGLTVVIIKALRRSKKPPAQRGFLLSRPDARP
jgi:hypothetical protein